MLPALLLAGLTMACSSPAPPEPVVPGPVVAGSEALDCAALDELACLDSPDCTLRQNEDSGYACTAPASDCERGFLQRAGRREGCAEDCSFTPAQCYCSPDVQCVCGGGPPAMCRAAR